MARTIKDCRKHKTVIKKEKEVIETLMGSMKRYQIFIVFTMYIIEIPICWQQTSHSMLTPPDEPIHCKNTTIHIYPKMEPENLNKALKEACDRKKCNRSDIVVERYFNDYSLVHQFDLYCDGREHLVTYAQTCVMMGILVGDIIFGFLADIFGRKPCVCWCSLGVVITGVATAWIPNIYCIMVGKFIVNTLVAGTMASGYTLFYEIIGENWRAAAGVFTNICFSIGYSCLSIFVHFVKDWRLFYTYICLTSAIFVYCFCLIPESPRWLISVGKIEKGIKTIEHIARINKMPTENIRELMMADIEEKKKRKTLRSGKFKDLFDSIPMSIITIGMWLNFCFIVGCYYGIGAYTVSFGHSPEEGIIYYGLFQLPSCFVGFVSLNFWSRKWTLFLCGIIGSISSITISFVSVEWKVVPAGFAGFALSLGFCTLYVYGSELFPTAIRNIGMGSSSAWGRAGSALCTAIVAQKNAYPLLPPALFCTFCATSALMTIFMPDTIDVVLADNVEDVRDFYAWKKPKKPTEEPSV